MQPCNHYCPGCSTGDCPLKDEIKELKAKNEDLERTLQALENLRSAAAIKEKTHIEKVLIPKLDKAIAGIN